MKDSLVFQVQQLLKFNKIAIDKAELAFQIKSHPSYPSLHAVTGVLDHFNIDNLALDVPVNEATLSQLPVSFLAQVKTEQGEDFAVVNNKGLNYELITNSNQKSTVSLSDFLKKFTGIIVAVEKEDTSNSFNSKSKLFSNTLVTIAVLAFIGYFLLENPSINNTTFFFLSLLGLYASTSIYKQELGEDSLLGNAFCSNATEKKSCDAVLNSKGATLFGKFKLSDLSLIYFSGLALSTFLLSISTPNSFSTLLTISLIALPITIYSIYYQYAVMKKWCLLCLSIVGIMWLQSTLLFFNSISITSINLKNISITAFSFSLLFLIWNYIKPLIEMTKEGKQTKIDYFKFKRNFNLFNTLLQKSPSISTKINDVSEIVFGNKNAALNITIVTNPFCGHCKAVHTLVEDILQSHNEKVKITIRFNVNVNNPESDVIKITTRLIELYHEKDAKTCLLAMHDIYGDLNADQWLAKWNYCEAPKKYLDVLQKENDWSKSNNINFTPELLINGRSFPKEYNRPDLIYFIEDLAEKSLTDNTTNIVITH